ncbi:hypothetical protein RBB50_008737 [Rhinocladiella similis]
MSNARPEESIFTPYLSPSLASHLSSTPTPIDVDSLSRTPLSRLQQTALPKLGLIELVSSTDFTTLYDDLYISSFPRSLERENSDLIVARLSAQAANTRTGLAPYHIVGLRDREGKAIGAAQFSVLPLPVRTDIDTDTDTNTNTNLYNKINDTTHPDTLRDGETTGPSPPALAVPYLQYIYIRPSSRRQDMSEVLHAFVLAVTAADAATILSFPTSTSPVVPVPNGVSTTPGSRIQTRIRTRTAHVPFTLFETEPPNHGTDASSRSYALERSKIHTSSGGIAVVLLRRHAGPRGDSDDDEESQQILSAHVQPGLEPDDPPLTLVWVIRPSPNPGISYDIKLIGKDLVAAYYQSLRDEGFPQSNIALAEKMFEERCRDAEFHLMPLADVSDFTNTS